MTMDQLISMYKAMHVLYMYILLSPLSDIAIELLM